jgi:hypothetical protein
MRDLGAIIRDRFNPAIWPTEQFATAIHEAAHAVVAMSLGHRVTIVAIEQRHHGWHRWTGNCEHRRYRDASEIDAAVETSLIIAGPFAATRYTDGMTRSVEGSFNGMFESDHREFVALYRSIAPSATFLQWQAHCTGIAARHLEANARVTELVTVCLLGKGYASERDLRILAPGIAARWEEYDTSSPAPVTRYAPPAPRRRPTPGTHGIRYGDGIPITAFR